MKKISYETAHSMCVSGECVQSFQSGYNEAVRIHNDRKDKKRNIPQEIKQEHLSDLAIEVTALKEAMKVNGNETTQAMKNLLTVVTELQNRLTKIENRVTLLEDHHRCQVVTNKVNIDYMRDFDESINKIQSQCDLLNDIKVAQINKNREFDDRLNSIEPTVKTNAEMCVSNQLKAVELEQNMKTLNESLDLDGEHIIELRKRLAKLEQSVIRSGDEVGLSGEGFWLQKLPVTITKTSE